MSNAVNRQILTVRDGCVSTELRELVDEVEYTIYIDRQMAGRFSCSPWRMRQTALGWLLLMGHISGVEQLRSLEVLEAERRILAELQDVPVSSLREELPPAICRDTVIRLSAMLEQASGLFKRTGGVHCAALADAEGFLAYEEDISRHAAVEKLAGACLEAGISMKNRILVFSGRIPGDIVRMASAMGCCLIIARSAPTVLACDMAREQDITLIGFARDSAFNVYACPHRIGDITE